MQKIKKILVAEDVDSNFVLIKNMIGKDYTLLWAKDGFEAVEMYKQFQPDLILMDIKMPRMGGPGGYPHHSFLFEGDSCHCADCLCFRSGQGAGFGSRLQ